MVTESVFSDSSRAQNDLLLLHDAWSFHWKTARLGIGVICRCSTSGLMPDAGSYGVSVLFGVGDLVRLSWGNIVCHNWKIYFISSWREYRVT